MALLFAWPLINGVAALFWGGHIMDGKNGGDRLADRIKLDRDNLLSTFLDERSPIAATFHGRDCTLLYGRIAHETWNLNPKRFPPSMDVDSALELYRTNQDASTTYVVKVTALNAMQPFLFGALGGCVDGSLLSRQCRTYLTHVVDEEARRSKTRILKEFEQHSVRTAEMACSIIDGTEVRSILSQQPNWAR